MNWTPDKNWFLAAVVLYGASTVYSLFLWRKGFRRDDRVNYGLLAFGMSLHTVAMLQRGFSYNRCPVNNLYEAIAFVGWALVAIYLALGIWPRLRFLGVFAAPVLLGIGVLGLVPEFDVPGPQSERGAGWLSSHAALVLLGYGAFGLASVAGLMFLSQDHDLRFRKLRAVVAMLPPIERLERVIERLILAGFILLTAGLVLGWVNLRRQEPVLSLWDAKVVWAAFVWLLYLGLLLSRRWYPRARRRFAWGAVASFGFVLLTFWGTNLMSAIHQQ